MPRCGADYWDLIRTPAGGTPEEPLTGMSRIAGVPDPEDWWAWHTLAQKLHEQASAQFKRLGDVEAAKLGGKTWPEWNRNITAQNELHAAWEAMGSFWTTSPTNGIPQAIRVCESAVCLLEGVDKSLAVYGEASHVSPTAAPATLGEKAIGWALLAGLGFLVWKADQSGDE